MQLRNTLQNCVIRATLHGVLFSTLTITAGCSSSPAAEGACQPVPEGPCQTDPTRDACQPRDCGSRWVDDGTLGYANTIWRSTHSGPRNNDHMPDAVMADDMQREWTALDGLQVVAPPVIGLDGTIYQTVGGPKGTSNLVAFDEDGAQLWATSPWEEPMDFDSCATTSAPVIDQQGFLYITDCDQFWAFHPDGKLKWVIDLPVPPEGQAYSNTNPFMTAFLGLNGVVGGVTVHGQVVVVDRYDGSAVTAPSTLPSVVDDASTAPSAPPPLWNNGEIDPEIKDLMQAIFVGSTHLATVDSPAIAETGPAPGRIFVSALSSDPAKDGALYGLDIISDADEPVPDADDLGSVVIAFETELNGAGGGSSPALSADNSQVYVGDGNGFLNVIDAADGSVLAAYDVENPAASPSVGSNDILYLSASGSGKAFDPNAGMELFTTDWSNFGTSLGFTDLSGIDARVTGPFSRIDGLITVLKDNISYSLMTFYSFDYDDDPETQALLLPVATHIVQVDQSTGLLASGTTPFALRTTNECIPLPLPSGKTYVCNASYLASLGQIGKLPSFGLPSEITDLIQDPVGGVEMFVPVGQ